MMLKLSLGLLVTAFLAAAFLGTRLRKEDPRLYEALGAPLAYEWYPFWVLRLLCSGRFRRLKWPDAVLASTAIVCMALGLLCGVALIWRAAAG